MWSAIREGRQTRSLSYMPQRFGLYEDLTVDENIRFYADLFGVKPQPSASGAPQQLLRGPPGMSRVSQAAWPASSPAA